MKRQLGNILSDLGLGWGSEFTGEMNYELKGFRPRPLFLEEGLDFEWDVGLPWYLKRLEGRKILDTGFLAHIGFTRLLADLGFEVWGLDIKTLEKKPKNIHTIQCPVWEASHHCSGFDTIIANSILEHLGLKYYGQPEFKEAPKATMEVFKESLTPNGQVLLQVPYGEFPVMVRHKGQDFYRVFTKESLQRILEGFGVVEKTFYAKTIKGWTEVSETVAGKIRTGGGLPSCLVYIKAVSR